MRPNIRTIGPVAADTRQYCGRCGLWSEDMRLRETKVKLAGRELRLMLCPRCRLHSRGLVV